MSDLLTFDDITFKSRLLIGTGKFSSIETMINSIKASETELVTVALKRFNKAKTEDELYGFANRKRVLGVNLPKWSDEQVKAIKWRLMEIRNKR